VTPIRFGHARWRVLILGVVGLAVGPLGNHGTCSIPPGILKRAAVPGFNHVPPLLRTAFILSAGLLLFAIGFANVWFVLRRSSALILDPDGLTAVWVLQGRLTVPWREIMRIEEGKARLVLHRQSAKPLVVSCDWYDAAPAEARAAVEEYWHAGRECLSPA
jgi:hypothetical protein